MCLHNLKMGCFSPQKSKVEIAFSTNSKQKKIPSYSPKYVQKRKLKFFNMSKRIKKIKAYKNISCQAKNNPNQRNIY